MLPSPILLKSTIRRIAIQTKHMATDALIGAFPSVFKGKGMEFDEVREYQEGDEQRDIDWNVTARMGRHFVKSFRQERQVTILLAVDLSASCRFGSCHTSKAVTIAELAAALAFSAISNNDRVGLLLFSDRIEKYIPPKQGQRHVLRIIRELLTPRKSHEKTDIKCALHYLSKVQRRFAICFIISDFLVPEDYLKEAMLASKRYDAIAIRVLDPLELVFPDVGLVQLRDLESCQQLLVDSSNAALRSRFAAEQQAALHRHTKLLMSAGIDLIDVQTDGSYMLELKKFFRMRLRKR